MEISQQKWNIRAIPWYGDSDRIRGQDEAEICAMNQDTLKQLTIATDTAMTRILQNTLHVLFFGDTTRGGRTEAHGGATCVGSHGLRSAAQLRR